MEPSTSSTPLPLRIDRDLPVSIHAQLVGQIEYGVATGNLPPGSQLPSVRELAERLDVSPVTVSHVFRTLRERELIETVPGRGSFVADGHGDRPAGHALAALHRAVDDVVRLADRSGVSREELAGLVSVRLSHADVRRPLRVHFVGIYDDATRAYGRALGAYLGRGCVVDTTTFSELDDDRLATLRRADLVLTFPYRRSELEALLVDGPRVDSLRFIPGARIRSDLAALTPFARVGVVSTLPAFLPTFLDGVRSYARHVADIRGTVLHAADLDALLATCDVVIYSTGASAIEDRLPLGVTAFEYRHEPDPVWIENEIVPVVQILTMAAFEAAPTPKE